MLTLSTTQYTEREGGQNQRFINTLSAVPASASRLWAGSTGEICFVHFYKTHSEVSTLATVTIWSLGRVKVCVYVMGLDFQQKSQSINLLLSANKKHC